MWIFISLHAVKKPVLKTNEPYDFFSILKLTISAAFLLSSSLVTLPGGNLTNEGYTERAKTQREVGTVDAA
jgi:hypothetical protein